MNVNSNKKHVRFDTPSKSDPRLMEGLSQLPSAYFLDDSDTEYSSKLHQSEVTSVASHRTDDQFGINTDVLPSSVLNYQTPDFNPPLRSFKQNISPKPSHDLELSLLDSIPSDFIVNRHTNVIPSTKKISDDKFKQDYYAQTFQFPNSDKGLSKKVYETDIPYMNLPTKTPIPKSISSLPLNLLAKIPHVSQHTEEEMPTKHDTKYGLGFFTLPNSRDYFSNRNIELSPKQCVEKSKNNYGQSTISHAKSNQHTSYQHLYSGENNNFHNHTVMHERPDPRCCNDKPPKPMLLPTAPMFNGTSHFNQNCTSNYPSNTAYHRHNGNIGSCQEAYNPNSWHAMSVQSCCSYPNSNNINQFVTQGYHTHQYKNANLQQTNNNGYLENPKSLMMNDQNAMPDPEDINNAVDLKRKAIESRCVRNETANNNCNDIVKVKDTDSNIVLNNDNKAEPTVSDLYQIIKLQNEQLQMLQQRVDKLLNVKEASNGNRNMTEDLIKPMHNLLSNQEKILRKDSMNMNCIEQSMHKISIGVMTSFEVVMSSNIVNKRDAVYDPDSKEIPTNNLRDGSVQTSQIFENFNVTKNHIKEKQNVIYNFEKNVGGGNNFLDGIAHCNKGNDPSFQLRNSNDVATSTKLLNVTQNNAYGQANKCFEDSYVTKNALYTQSKDHCIPIQSHTKQLVPNSSLHLNTDEYSNSDSECSQPNAGWTFYNNVMNRVNDMLHSPPEMNRDILKDSKNHDYRITTGQTHTISTPIRYQGDLYVEKRQPQTPTHSNKPVSETSLHMKRLAAKYLNNNDESMRHESKVTFSPHVNIVTPAQHSPYVADIGNEMSFATMQYMKRYHLTSVDGDPGQLPRIRKKMNSAGSHEKYLKPIYKNPSRILDITTLKQQPKLM